MTFARIAIFASGHGSNLQTFIDITKARKDFPAEIALVVSDKPSCYAVQRARDANVPVFAASPKEYPDKAAFESAVLEALRDARVEWIVLAGYMRIVGMTLLDAYPGRILNIHPSLLPAFPGKQAVKDALLAGSTETGVTVHLVDEGIDTGPILAQERIAIAPGESEESLLARVHEVEHRLYPRVVEQIVLRHRQAQ